MSRTIGPIIAGFVLSAILAWTVPARAELTAVFSMETCVGKSKAIVQGNLQASGELKITRVLDGKLEDATTIKLQTGEWQYKSLRTETGHEGPYEVVAFLEEKWHDEWRLVLQLAGLAAFDREKVVLKRERFIPEGSEPDREYSPAGFLQAVAEAVSARDERNRLIAMPRSAERTRRLLAFALVPGHVEEWRKVMLPGSGYSFYQVVGALCPPTGEDQNLILEAIHDAATPRERILLLDLCGSIPLRDEALETLAAFMPRTNPPEVRQAAMRAVARVNGYRAVDYLLPYLVPDDPEILTALGCMGSLSSSPQDRLLNRAVLDPLVRLAVMHAAPGQETNVAANLPNYIGAQLVHYLHPRTLPALWTLAFDAEPNVSAQNFVYLCEATGLSYPLADRKRWNAWRRGAAPFLEQEYDLGTGPGRQRWMDRYAKADPATRRILMQLWFFEPVIDEPALIEAATANETARKVLATLWQRGRLSRPSHRAIIERFLSVKLVNQPPPGAAADPTLYGAAFVVTSSFPFPESAWTENQRAMTIGARQPDFGREAWSSWSLHDQGVTMLSFKDTAHAPTPPVARALMEIREVDLPDQPTGEVWKLRWELGPVQLGPSLPP